MVMQSAKNLVVKKKLTKYFFTVYQRNLVLGRRCTASYSLTPYIILGARQKEIRLDCSDTRHVGFADSINDLQLSNGVSTCSSCAGVSISISILFYLKSLQWLKTCSSKIFSLITYIINTRHIITCGVCSNNTSCYLICFIQIQYFCHTCSSVLHTFNLAFFGISPIC